MWSGIQLSIKVLLSFEEKKIKAEGIKLSPKKEEQSENKKILKKTKSTVSGNSPSNWKDQ